MIAARLARYRRWLCKRYGHKPGPMEYYAGVIYGARFCKRCDTKIDNWIGVMA
jgi:hypothetical protein